MDDNSSNEANDMFMGLIPEHRSIEIDGIEWLITKKEIEPGLNILNVSNQGVEVDIGAFIGGDKFLIKGPVKQKKFQVEFIPSTEDEMEKFIYNFFNDDLGKIVKMVT